MPPAISTPSVRAPGCRAAPAGLAAAALLLMLGGCTPAPDRTASRVLEEVLESHRASMAVLDGAPAATKPSPNALGTPAAARRGAPGSVAALIGQSREGVVSVLGQPTRRRPEGDAEIWLYQGSNCALDVVLYRDSNTPRVAWAAARAAGAQRQTEAGCLSELQAG
ncbi:hypothetical protein [Muricoccus aerilatus]|uniref:hypothetical protein n=1 Tax=Muricoccus aerilatus TaxID=452982 RepID=UPI00069463E0|nr:hypothetical protein [Roseomonas aerilata]